MPTVRPVLTDGVVAGEPKGVQSHLHALHEVVRAEGTLEVLLHGVGAPCNSAKG